MMTTATASNGPATLMYTATMLIVGVSYECKPPFSNPFYSMKPYHVDKDLDTAAQTIGATTHKGMLRLNMYHDRKDRLRSHHQNVSTAGVKWYTDTNYVSEMFMQGTKRAQGWINGKGTICPTRFELRRTLTRA